VRPPAAKTILATTLDLDETDQAPGGAVARRTNAAAYSPAGERFSQKNTRPSLPTFSTTPMSVRPSPS
jgi:hypothetical protein